MLIGLTGLAGAGKDVLASWLIRDHSFRRANFGDLIKDSFDDFTQGRETLAELEAWMSERLNTEGDEARLQAFLSEVAEPYAKSGLVIPARTEDRGLKPHIRRILEAGGEVIHRHLVEQYQQDLTSRLSCGYRLVNTRVAHPQGKPEEYQAILAMGGRIFEIHRPGYEAEATDWDRQSLQRLRDAGAITLGITNAGTSAEHWSELAREAARILADAGRPAQAA